MSFLDSVKSDIAAILSGETAETFDYTPAGSSAVSITSPVERDDVTKFDDEHKYIVVHIWLDSSSVTISIGDTAIIDGQEFTMNQVVEKVSSFWKLKMVADVRARF